MNLSKRAFLKTAGAVAVTINFTPMAAFAASGQAEFDVFIKSDDGSDIKGQFTARIDDCCGKVGDIKGESNARYNPLVDAIIRWLRDKIPKGMKEAFDNGLDKEIGADLNRQFTKQLNGTPGWGEDTGKELPGIKVKIRGKFKPPNDWEISIEISF